MTDRQINLAIAKACGWTDIRDSGVWHNFAPWGLPPQVKSPKETSSDCISVPNFVPNYCNDLNAMHEAEKVLMLNDNWRMGEYEARLFNSVEEMNNVNLCFHATARQRAEAFLRTLGKWEEVQP
jgi:hypothetical protein